MSDHIEKFQALVDRFQLDKAGARPFDGLQLDESFNGASHGEKVSINFLLNVWDPGNEWTSGKFDVIGLQHQAEGSKRKTTFWCAPELDYLPVIIEQHRLEKLKVRAMLSRYTPASESQAADLNR